jgi:hypothetical protein
LDSGADNVLFPSDLAEAIGIPDISQGRRGTIMGIAGQRTDAYFFNLELEVLGYSQRLPIIVGFSDKIFVPILGRSFFTHYQISDF